MNHDAPGHTEHPNSVSLPGFAHLINLCSGRLGAEAISFNDEFFAEAENLVKPGRGIFIADKYTDRGKWMDGWETRRRRTPGHDWCILKLGLRGRIHGVDIDTNHFLGNHPPFASLMAADVPGGVPHDKDWREILVKSPLQPGSRNLFTIKEKAPFTHLCLNIYPDGGVARLKAFGEVVPNWSALKAGQVIDLIAVENGGRVLCCNDMFFSSKDNLIMPGRGVNMGDGWETKRRRTPGHDWVITQLGRPGRIQEAVIDTCHFKGNYPDRCSLDAIYAPGATEAELRASEAWVPLMEQEKLSAHHIHRFNISHPEGMEQPITHVRMNIFPDGGVSRLRLMGVPA